MLNSSNTFSDNPKNEPIIYIGRTTTIAVFLNAVDQTRAQLEEWLRDLLAGNQSAHTARIWELVKKEYSHESLDEVGAEIQKGVRGAIIKVAIGTQQPVTNYMSGDFQRVPVPRYSGAGNVRKRRPGCRKGV